MDRFDNKKFKQFVSLYEDRAYKVLEKRFSVLSGEEIRDIVHDAYFVLCKSIIDKKISEPVYSYFVKICINLSLKSIRKNGSNVIVGINDTEVRQKNTISMYKVESILQVDDEALSIKKERQQIVREALSSMATRCRELLQSFYTDEMSWSAIADQCGLKNAETAKSSASRCRQTFKEKYNYLKSHFYGK